MAERTPKTVKKVVKKAAAKAVSQKAATRKPGRTPSPTADWREATLDRMRALIFEAEPAMIEERKWRKPSNPDGVAVWSRDGLVCTGEIYKKAVKITFAQGAALPDPNGLFNASLDGGTRRAIDIAEAGTVNARAFKALVKAAALRNRLPKNENGVTVLSGGNPQIAKGDGDAPVQAYIANMPDGWMRDLGRRLDALITKTLPGVRKAVKWNSPFYGVEGKGWALSFHVLTKYVKVTFFSGRSLDPVPPGGTPKSGEARWLDIYEKDGFDEARLKAWIRQAATLPGWLG